MGLKNCSMPLRGRARKAGFKMYSGKNGLVMPMNENSSKLLEILRETPGLDTFGIQKKLNLDIGEALGLINELEGKKQIISGMRRFKMKTCETYKRLYFATPV